MSESIRNTFLGWQCRLRQMSMRDHDGRPQPGMRPRILDDAGNELVDAATVLIVHEDPDESRDLFRHIVKRTHDPKERRDAAIKLLSSTHYQYPNAFSDHLTAAFSNKSSLVAQLAETGTCTLEFHQFGQGYTLPCRVTRLDQNDPFWQNTYWHNHMFNPDLPGDIAVLAFTPDWSSAVAETG